MTVLILDGEKLVSQLLRVHANVAALNTRIVGKTPTQTASSWVRLTQLDARNAPGSRAEHLIDYLFQADCYAGADGGQPEASLLGRTIRAALHEMAGFSNAEAVVTSVRFNGMVRIPDTEFEPARERVILTATVHMHPVGPGS